MCVNVLVGMLMISVNVSNVSVEGRLHARLPSELGNDTDRDGCNPTSAVSGNA